MRRILPAIFVIILILIDQWTKYLALIKLKPMGYSMVIIEKFFGLYYVENRGAAFGILQGARWFFVALTLIIITSIVYYYVKLPHTRTYGWIRFALLMVSAGAVANCIDRVRNGYVIDFFQTLFMDFPVFNMADIYVVTGSCLLILLMMFFVKDEKEPESSEPGDSQPIQSSAGE